MIWDFIKEKLDLNIDVYLITVTEIFGSSPGKVGFKMAVAADGDLYGSIGGGVMEYRLVEIARENLKNREGHNFLKRQIHSHEAEDDKSGMICSGEQTQVFSILTKANVDVISKVATLVRENKPGKLVISPNGIEVYEGNSHLSSSSTEFHKNGINYRYSEPLGIMETVYIFGAGHISAPLSQILKLLDFRVELYDNRESLNTFESNTSAHKKGIVDYEHISDLVPENKRSYVVIMTFEHKFDEIVLKQLINKDVKYLGMIGSKSKVKIIIDDLVAQGYSRETLERVCSPIGLPIGGQTPAEIAVSIAAQIVEWRNKK